MSEPVVNEVTVWNLALGIAFLTLTIAALLLELTRQRRLEFMLFMWVLVIAAFLNLNGVILMLFPSSVDAGRFIGAALRAVILLSFAGYVFYRLRHADR